MVYITTLAYPFACFNRISPTLKYLKNYEKKQSVCFNSNPIYEIWKCSIGFQY